MADKSPKSKGKMSSSGTVGQCLTSLMRVGRLDTFDKDVLKILFCATSINLLRKLLACYSIQLHSSVSHGKAVEMCHKRFYKNSEAGRQEAVRTIESSPQCARFLSSSMQDLIPAKKEIPLIDLEMGDLDGCYLMTNGSGELNRSTDTESGSTGSDQKSGCTSSSQSSVLLVDEEPLKMLHDLAFPRRILQVPEVLKSDSLIEVCENIVDELGRVALKMRIPDFVDEHNNLDFALPADAPTVLGLAEPAFFELKSCLSSFTFPANSPMEIIRHTLHFNAPLLKGNEKVILIFRSVGILRDNRQADLPVGFSWTLNTGSAPEKQEKPKPKDWDNELAIFNAPIILDGCQTGGTNTLEFSFFKRPVTRSDFNCRYQGYVFVASPRSVERLVRSIPSIPALASVKDLLTTLRGGFGKVAYDRITLSLNCVLTYGRLKNPCRSLTSCEHPAVFGADAFLEMNRVAKAPRWKCPRCGQVVHWYMLRRDKLLEFLLEKFPNCNEVLVRLDEDKKHLLFSGIPEVPELDDGMD